MTFAADGDFRQAVAIRLEKAKARFGMLWKIWGSDLPRSAQINLYSAAVVSILTHGYEAWPMTEKLMTSIKHFNARCLSKITKLDCAESYRTQDQYFDIIQIIRARRFKWAGKILRTEGPCLTRDIMLAKCAESISTGKITEGCIQMDFPKFTSTDQLLATANDIQTWNTLEKLIHSNR